MTYEFANESDIEEAKADRYSFYSWAAGEPGTLFDKPGDVLWCNGGSRTRQLEDWAKANNIPLSFTSGSGVKIEGWRVRICQVGANITLYKSDGGNFAEIFRCIDTLLPEMLPCVINIDERRGKGKYIKGVFFSLFEPSLSEFACYDIFYSGDTWMLIRQRWGATSVEFENTDREAFFTQVLDRFGWTDDTEGEDDDDDETW